MQLKHSTKLPYKGTLARYVIIPKHNYLPWTKILPELVPKYTFDTMPTEDPTPKMPDLDHCLTESIYSSLGKGHPFFQTSPCFNYLATVRKLQSGLFQNIRNVLASVKQSVSVFAIMPQVLCRLTLWAIKDGSICSQKQKSPEERK